MLPIGEWVLRTACRQAKAWLDGGLMVPRLAINVSVAQFTQSGFAQLVAAILEETGLDAGLLELEVTESVLMGDAENAVHTLYALGTQGVQLAIDDFGTGASSLGNLKNYPVSRLKIDQSFVGGVGTQAGDAAVTSAVIALAAGMNLKVTAEGVETEEQLDFLKARHCDEIQGFFLSRPLPPNQVAAMLDRRWATPPRGPWDMSAEAMEPQAAAYYASALAALRAESAQGVT
jgi:EAL domain-containing protein (putative c-di-GMP-specific phosphodiesterase class I)